MPSYASSYFCRIVSPRELWEGIASEFLAGLAKDGRYVVTVLRTNQYEGIESFTGAGKLVLLSCDRQGEVTREVAPAGYSLLLPDHPGISLDLRVALVRDLRGPVPCPTPQDRPSAPHADYADNPSSFEDAWIASAAPSVPTEPALVAIVTTATEIDPVEMARVYSHR